MTRRQLLFRVFAVSISLTLGILAVEVIARVVWATKYVELLESQTRGFDQVDRARQIIIPRPGEVRTVGALLRDLRSLGKSGSVRALELQKEYVHASDTDEAFRINSHGFKGPEFNLIKPVGTYRILAIGDSCTWGPYIESASYPRLLESTLRNELGTDAIEVINGGVMGYNTRSVVRRLDDYLRTNPDLVLIYIGWNGTIVRADPYKSDRAYRLFASYRIFYHGVVNRSGSVLESSDDQPLRFDPEEPIISELRETTFDYDMRDLHHVVTAFRAHNPEVLIAVVTLAGLFDERVAPVASDYELAFRLSFSNNLYAWPVLTARFNEKLRKFAAEEDLLLFDFENWALENFRPRGQFFTDPVHPSIPGYSAMADYLADEIVGHTLIRPDVSR